METFKRYTFREFLNLQGEKFQRYENTGLLLKHDSWGVSDILNWDYITVKEIQSIMFNSFSYEQLIDIIKRLTGYKKDKILETLWMDVFRFYRFIKDSIERVNELEEKLQYDPDSTEEKAGIDMFNQFGYFVTIDRLAGGDPLKYEEIGKMEYSVIFSKLLLTKTDIQFTKNYHKQISKQ